MQLRIAAGEPLGLRAGRRRAATATRSSAGSPPRIAEHGFQPSPGTLSRLRGARAAAGCASTPTATPAPVVPPYYDSLLAKLIAHGADRAQAIEHPARRRSTSSTSRVCETNRDAPGRRARTPRLPRPARSPPTGSRGAADALEASRHEVEFVDTTTRDGNQSLWSATGLTTPDVLAIAPTMDRVGYHALDFTSSTHMAVSVRFHREDPWERIRLVSAAMPNTPLSMITTGMRFISWVPADEDVMRAVVSPGRPQRHPPLADRRPLQRSRAPEAPGRDGARRGRRGGRDRPDLLDQPGAHPRLLRAARRRAGRLRRRWTGSTSRTRAAC